jgi:apolipoprotein N-acyltransferase
MIPIHEPVLLDGVVSVNDAGSYTQVFFLISPFWMAKFMGDFLDPRENYVVVFSFSTILLPLIVTLNILQRRRRCWFAASVNPYKWLIISKWQLVRHKIRKTSRKIHIYKYQK